MRKLFKLFLCGSMILASVTLAPELVDAAKDPITGTDVKKTSVVEYINIAYSRLAVIGSLLAVLMLLWAGYRYMTSYGDPEKISDAKQIIEQALLGLGLLILAAVILGTVNPRTVNPCTSAQIEAAKRGANNGCGSIDFSKPQQP